MSEPRPLTEEEEELLRHHIVEWPSRVRPITLSEDCIPQQSYEDVIAPCLATIDALRAELKEAHESDRESLEMYRRARARAEKAEAELEAYKKDLLECPRDPLLDELEKTINSGFHGWKARAEAAEKRVAELVRAIDAEWKAFEVGDDPGLLRARLGAIKVARDAALATPEEKTCLQSDNGFGCSWAGLPDEERCPVCKTPDAGGGEGE